MTADYDKRLVEFAQANPQARYASTSAFTCVFLVIFRVSARQSLRMQITLYRDDYSDGLSIVLHCLANSSRSMMTDVMVSSWAEPLNLTDKSCLSVSEIATLIRQSRSRQRSALIHVLRGLRRGPPCIVALMYAGVVQCTSFMF